jgi:hypothetical protein
MKKELFKVACLVFGVSSFPMWLSYGKYFFKGLDKKLLLRKSYLYWQLISIALNEKNLNS